MERRLTKRSEKSYNTGIGCPTGNRSLNSYCLEHGIPIRQGAGVFKIDLKRILDDTQNDLTDCARLVLRDLSAELDGLEARLKSVSSEIKTVADTDERARRLMTIPGIGPLGATAVLAAAGDAKRFDRARDVAAWLGLVPKQNSTGGKQTLMGISKRGSSYLRKLLIHGARSVLMHLDRSKDRLGVWVDHGCMSIRQLLLWLQSLHGSSG